jgi:hypothetical protein
MRLIALVGLAACSTPYGTPAPKAGALDVYEPPERSTSDTGTSDSTGTIDTTASTHTSDSTDTTTESSTTASCPPGLICVDRFPYMDGNSTTGSPSTLDAYSCGPTIDEGGPEVVYQVELAEEGFLAASLSGLGAGVDVDVHLLEAFDSSTCIDRGHWDSGALLPAGTYYVVVDSWVDSSGDAKDGAYTLQMNVTTADAFAGYGLDPAILELGLWAFDEAWFDGETERLVYGILDFSLPLDERRMFIFDLVTGEMLFDVYASHGIGSQDPSDLTKADWFSNVSGSNASSLGMVRAAETYYGSNGYSLRLDGLDSSFNDNVRDRAIVIHPADYATEAFVNTYGYLGRSQGCPAVDPAVSADIIDTLADGALLLAYYPDPAFLSGGRFVSSF